MRKRIKYVFIVIIILAVGLISFFAWFFISNEAPLIYGKVIWHQDYKENLKLDIYLPTKLVYEKVPVILYIHGGAWITGSKETVNINRFNDAFNRLREKGYAIVSPDYTLANRDRSPFPDCIVDFYDALFWIENNAEKYQFDLQNVGAFGESAGAHIALLSAYSNAEVFNTNQSEKIQLNYVVDMYGPTDLTELYNSSLVDSLRNYLQRLPGNLEDRLDMTHYLFGFDPEEDTIKTAKFMKKYSPVSFLNSSIPPTLLIHGVADQIVPVEQSLLLKTKLDSLHIKNELHVLEDVDHAFRGASQIQKDSIQIWIVDFILEHQFKSKS